MTWDDKRLSSEFGTVNRKLDNLDTLIRGDTKYSGLKSKVDALETREDDRDSQDTRRSRVLWGLCVTVIGVVLAGMWGVIWP